MTLEIQEIARATGSKPVEARGFVSDFSIDSRTVKPDSLFFALHGARDGHDFVPDAMAKGASAAIVERPLAVEGVLLEVADSLKALERLGTYARSRLSGDLVGVTGSAGKTTTKETIAALLATEFPVGRNEANLNNHLGVPLSLLRVPEAARAIVLEMGMNHPGEIRHLCAIARPNIGVVTNAGYAHVENFHSIEGVALAKRELVEALPSDGVAVLNADDPRVFRFREVHAGRSVTFGIRENANVRAEEVEYRPDGARFRVDSTMFDSPLAGRHGVLNVLAALAVARIFGIAPRRLVAAVRGLVPQKMRGVRIFHNGIVILDDCYNSNPDAVRAMLDLLKAEPAARHIAVLGEMLELGRWSVGLHRSVGDYACEAGISVLIGIRGAACHIINEAVTRGLPAAAAYFFDEPEQAGEFLRELARPGDAILFKGSRGTKVELALKTFLEQPGLCGAPGDAVSGGGA